MPAMIHAVRPSRALAALSVLGAIFVLLQYVPLGTLPHPVVVDDYTNVGSSIADMSTRWKRPVSANLIFLFAHYAPASSYFAMAALAVLNAALVLWLLSQVFAVRVPMAVVAAFGIVTFSHVSAFNHAFHLGLLTNLISHLFGLASMAALWQGWKRGGSAWFVVALLAYALGAFAKEDFLLPPLLLAGLLALRAREEGTTPASARGYWMQAAVLFAIAAASLAWHALDRNPFVAGLFAPERSPAPYVVDLSPRGLASSYWTLLGGFAPLACGVAALAWVAMFLRLRGRRVALLWYLAVVLALVLPYAIIPRTIVPARVYAWLPWLVAIAAVAWASMQAAIPPARRVLASATVLVLALAAAWLQWPARGPLLAEYAGQVAKNRTMVETLLLHRGQLDGHPEIGLVGLGEWGPWCAQDALYVNGKLGFEGRRWLVFVPAPTRCYTQQERDVARKRGVNVGVQDLATLCSRGPLPVLEYLPDGTGQLRSASDYCPEP